MNDEERHLLEYENYKKRLEESIPKETDKKVKDWLENISLDKYNVVDISRYIREMRHNSTWGGAPEIALVSKIFKVIIR